MAAVIKHRYAAPRSIIPALLFAVGALLLSAQTKAQSAQPPSVSNLQRIRIVLSPLPQQISSQTILPNTIRLYGDTTGIAWHLDSTLTRISFAATPSRYGDSITIAFRSIDLPLHAQFTAKQLLNLLSPDSALAPLLPESRPRKAPPPPPPITIKGVAERSMGMGSLAYAAPTSAMINLSIEGPLHRSTRFETHIVDNSLPFLPDGTSARIDNINKLFLRVYDSTWCIEAGDILIEESQGTFLRQREETLGIGGSWRGNRNAWDSLALRATLGTAKGEIERTDIRPADGIQGPYALLGNHEFAQVVIRAGTERVFLDGELLARGELNDYTIDYNLGCITFTAKRPINRLSRIVVEYETTKRTYTRLLGHLSTSARNRNGWQLDLKAYFAQDRAASLPAELKEAGALQLLKSNPATANGELLLENAKQVDGKTNSGYIKTDTTLYGRTFTLFQYRPAGHSDSLLALPFTYVGPNRGDYLLTQREHNERVFQWVAPIDGIPQGDYAPGTRVPTPSGHAMAEATIAKRWHHTPADASLTAAYAMQNENTLTNAGKRQSYALEFSQNARIARYGSDGLYLHTRGRWVANDFTPARRFLPLEFSRTWGENEVVGYAPWADAAVALSSRTAHSYALMRGEMLWRPTATAWRGSTQLHFNLSRWSYSLAASALVRNADSAQTTRGAIATSLSRAFTYIRIQGDAKSEWLIPLRGGKGTLLSPYAFAEGGATIALSDTLATQASLRTTYRRTWDTASPTARLQPCADALESILETSTPLGAHGLLKGCVSARATFTSQAYSEEPRNLTLLTSITYSQALARQRLHVNSTLSLASEHLPKWQFHFIPVPIGQGTHEWHDANGDGKPQLDEFFPAQHADQALFVKQMVASSELQKAHSAATALALDFSPRANNRPIDSLTRWWQRFDISISLEHAAKRTDRHIGKLFNPLDASGASSLPERQRAAHLSSALNKNAPPIFLTYSLTLSDYRQTMAQGVASGESITHRLALETPTRKGLGGLAGGEIGRQKQHRPYASQANESIATLLAEVALIWRGKSSQTYKIRAEFGQIALEPNHSKVKSQRYSYEMDVPLAKKWTIAALASYCRVAGDNVGRHALAYQALKGNSNGNNFNAQATLSYKITTYLNLNATYSFRKHGKAPAINSGFVTLRATF